MGECFLWWTHGQFSKGDSCSISLDRLVQGDLYGGQRRKGQSSSPVPNSKAKTDGEGDKKPAKIRATEMKALSSDKRAKFRAETEIVIIRHAFFGVLPFVKTTSLRLDAHLTTNDFPTC